VVISVWATLILVAISDHVTLLFLGFFSKKKTRGESCCALAIYIKTYLKAKEEELWKHKNFTMQNYNLQKSLSKKKKPKSFKIV